VRGNPARTFVASWRENARAPVAGVIRIQIVIGSAMRVFDFHHAIVRAPCRSVIDGIRSDAHAEPSFEKISKEHETYVAALRDAGLAVDVLPPLERYPDSMFVEDPAFVIPEGAIQLRSGADARRGEGEEIASALRRHFHTVLALEGDEYVDGGDVLIAPDGIFIGLSKRTNRKGAEALREMLAKLGRKSRIAQTPDTILHFKTAVSLLTEDMLVTTKVMAASGIFAGFKIFMSYSSARIFPVPLTSLPNRACAWCRCPSAKSASSTRDFRACRCAGLRGVDGEPKAERTRGILCFDLINQTI
jgi:dimethylargininase